MSTSYRDVVQYATTSEEDTTSPSSSSDDESQCTKSATKETVAVKIINNTYKFEALNELRHMVQTQGQLPLGLLDNGSKTRDFFCSGRRHGRRWRLKTRLEYGQVTRGKSKFNSLDDLKKIRPVCHLSDEDTMAQVEDMDNFIDLLSGPNTKSACEMMEVCRDQSQRSEDMEQDPWLNPQASTSTATPNQHYTPSQVAPAWHNHQEHPLVLEVALAIFSSLSICDDQSPPQPQQLSCSVAKGKATPEQQLPTTSVATSDTGKVSDMSKLKRSPDSSPAPKKRMRMDSIETHAEQHKTSKEAPAEASSSTATATPVTRKRTWANFVASYTGSRTPCSPERKKRKMSQSHDSNKAPTDESETQKKRKRQDSNQASSSEAKNPEITEKYPDCSSPKRKKKKKIPSGDSGPNQTSEEKWQATRATTDSGGRRRPTEDDRGRRSQDKGSEPQINGSG
ncbi:hypothetical protein ABVT39_005490 [Epinephelus coioides]